MTIRLGVVMDPIAGIYFKKDSTLAMLLEGARRGWQLCYMEPQDLYVADGVACARWRELEVFNDPQRWYAFGPEHDGPLDLHAILMRKDPPFNMEYIYSTYALELAEASGCLVVNRPQALRDANEKLFTAWFPEITPPTLVTRQRARIHSFLREQGDIILKPLDGMGGRSIFRLRPDDPNLNVILETMLGDDQTTVMAQRFVPEIRDGDKRILLVDGKPVPYALARIPPPGETRGNLAVGGRGEAIPLVAADYRICERIAPTLRERGVLFCGLDVIGDRLTEINVTSPTCIRELDAAFGLNISAGLMDAIEQRLTT
ncbi:MAG: glutathione synthase [Gammaproteobacteria bacterium]|nr:glutathione synthase [Gammaproteobacteria bacterium]